jgi:hypothetical protein
VGSSNNFVCAECAAIVSELKAAHQSDVEQLRESWFASGRDLTELRNQFLASIAEDDSADLFHVRYPRTREVQRKRAEHESRTGDSVFRLGQRR